MGGVAWHGVLWHLADGHASSSTLPAEGKVDRWNASPAARSSLCPPPIACPIPRVQATMRFESLDGAEKDRMIEMDDADEGALFSVN